MQTKKHIAFRLRKSLIEDLKALAAKRGDSFTVLVEQAISALIERYDRLDVKERGD